MHKLSSHSCVFVPLLYTEQNQTAYIWPYGKLSFVKVAHWNMMISKSRTRFYVTIPVLCLQDWSSKFLTVEIWHKRWHWHFGTQLLYASLQHSSVVFCSLLSARSLPTDSFSRCVPQIGFVCFVRHIVRKSQLEAIPLTWIIENMEIWLPKRPPQRVWIFTILWYSQSVLTYADNGNPDYDDDAAVGDDQ